MWRRRRSEEEKKQQVRYTITKTSISNLLNARFEATTCPRPLLDEKMHNLILQVRGSEGITVSAIGVQTTT